MRKYWIPIVVVATLLGIGAQPVGAGCPPDTVCVTVPAGTTAEELRDLIESNWNISPDFTCNASTTESGGVEIQADNGERIIIYEVPAGTVQSGFTYNLRFANPIAAGETPFDMFVDYDNTGEILIRDGTTVFPEINMVVSTTPTGAAVPLLDPVRTAVFVVGLLAVGAAILRFRTG